ncbi:hypothetical protein CC78DRAFT_527966, partial [Lojkania enalia]
MGFLAGGMFWMLLLAFRCWLSLMDTFYLFFKTSARVNFEGFFIAIIRLRADCLKSP